MIVCRQAIKKQTIAININKEIIMGPLKDDRNTKNFQVCSKICYL